MHKLAHAIAILLTAMLVLAPARATPRYDLKATIEPAAGSVAVAGDVDIPVEPGQSELAFVLHESFAVSKLLIGGKPANFAYQDIQRTPFNPASRKVVVKLPAGLGATVHLTMAYAGVLEKLPEWGAGAPGQLSMDDQVNPRLVQLAGYSSWYPQFFEFGRKFDSTVEVSLPAGWMAVSGGTKTDLGLVAGRAITRWMVPGNFDIVLTAAPNFHKVTGAGVEIYHTDMPAAVVQGEARDLSAVMALFRKQLGETAVPGGVIRHVYAPMVHGQGRAGIARAGLIVTSEGRVHEALAADPSYSLFQDIAHEIAHFWWNFGTGQGDWINESFAEYFSALAVRDLVSPQAFEAALARYRKGVAGLPANAPSLASVPKDGGEMAWIIRYQKGSLMLDALRRAMGDEAFFKASHAFFDIYKGRGAETPEFRTFWGERLGDKKAMLDRWLDTGGATLG